MDHIEYDSWTDEIIPKQEISTYSNDEKYITNSKGEEIKFSKIKEEIERFREVQGDYASFSKNKVKK